MSKKAIPANVTLVNLITTFILDKLLWLKPKDSNKYEQINF